jgi:hypothetical protein
VLLWIKSKYIWPKLFSKKNENMMIKLQKKVYPGI